MGQGFDEDPPEETYGCVTNAERYRVLHAAARELIERLCVEHRPERVDGTDLDPGCSRMWPGSPATTLRPADGASLTLTFTPFPGVMVRYGFAGRSMFPACGCDACDEDPDDEAHAMAELVDDVISGSFSETRRQHVLRPDTYESEITRGAGSRRTEQAQIDPELTGGLAVGTTRWPPWAGAP